MVTNSTFNALYKYTKALSVALGYRDQLTRLHSDRVLALSVEMGLHCGLSASEIDALRIGAAFHDIGKIGIPDDVLLKPGKLDPAEWQCMQGHSEIGEQILLSTDLKGAKSAALAIRHHHEHFNGTGYPDRLRGEKIPLAARIIHFTQTPRAGYCYDIAKTGFRIKSKYDSGGANVGSNHFLYPNGERYGVMGKTFINPIRDCPIIEKRSE